ncbi:Z1 domain-containing protein [Dysgonomonas sp. Marseille-P4677]|uniref:Z1 domain-containing protein n=1 Tax=Dysgonomonas sp. Marseille-P4677 TaxID=2364790 RepID=UPI0019142099|nr:Z1 domain-containing protein [Dysgonomonas sp. Marseille-P4677]MBK5719543.1 Z1 domain-containing protein [Dysgonomonas sp. Marseille-P4677]
MSDNYQIAIEICQSIIGRKTSVTDDEINEAIVKVKIIYSDVDAVKLKNDLLSMYSVKIDTFQILEGRERREPWLKDFKANQKTKWAFWTRYTEYLEKQKKFPPTVILQLDELTDKVLDKLFNPQRSEIQISKKGLVVGQVQSGKTANYTGLICKAADTGFNLIIVLAGIHNNLRSQTQNRIDEGFLGFDTQYERAYTMNKTTKIGVGLIPGFENAIANSYTTSLEKGDFTSRATNTAGFNFNAPQPILLVVKKNASVLKRLYNWLHTHTQATSEKISNKSLLIIDDEADNASINTNRKELDPTTINKNICSIISLFNRSAYVGYTATPFANIFIPQNEDDLFPRDFIINIPAPTNYIGPEKVFGTSIIPDDTDNDLLPIVCPIKDYDFFVPQGHKKDDDKPSFSDIPESLKTAIKCFIVTCAIRIARGQGAKHNSMLIHISRFQMWQNHIKELVEDLFNYYKHEIEANDALILEEFRRVLENDTANYKSHKTVTTEIKQSKHGEIDKNLIVHSWEEIKPLLYKAVQKVEIKSINGTSGDCLTYYENEKTGVSVIAIGGDKLSRGLTLEGLSVSYFLRASKMYDTLMQMGRWFGYRPGYVDLCRLFTSGELNEWFRHITIASEELRSDFDYLASINGTPEDYALKVRNSPGQLQITSISKMRYTKQIEVSWAGRLIETYQLPMDKGSKKKNLIATDNFLTSLGSGESKGNNYLWRDVSPDDICDYFAKFKVADSLKKVDLDLINSYIQELVKKNELTSWRVVLMNKKDKAEAIHTFSNGIKVGCFDRNRADDTNWTTYYIRKNHIVGNQKDEFIDLDSNLLDAALRRTRQVKKNWSEKEYPAPEIVRQEFRPRTNPLLLIYPLNPECANIKDRQGNIIPETVTYHKNDEPFIGFAISFPNSEKYNAISYTVNQIAEFKETEDLFDSENDNIYDE